MQILNTDDLKVSKINIFKFTLFWQLFSDLNNYNNVTKIMEFYL